MLTVRKILSVTVLFILTACGSMQGQTPVSPEQPEGQKQHNLPSAEPGTLAASIPAVQWKGNLEGNMLVPIDPENGHTLTGYEPIPLGQSYSYVFSPDTLTLAVVGFVSSEHPRGGSLHLIDLETWDASVQELQLDAYVNAMDFSPNGSQLAIAYGNVESRVLVLDLDKPAAKSKSARLQTTLDFLVDEMSFTPDGRELMVYGTKIENRYTVNEMSPNPPIALLLGISDLNERWRTDLEGIRHGVLPKDGKENSTADLHQPGQAVYYFPGLAFAPDHDVLYVVHPDDEVLTTVNFGTQKVNTTKIEPRLSWFERFLSLTADVAFAKIAEGTNKQTVISPDGQFIYIVGQDSDLIQNKNGEWQVIGNSLGLQIVRAEDGSRLAYHDTEAKEISISADGRHLYLRGWEESQTSAWTEIFDPDTEQIITKMEGLLLTPTIYMNGAPALVSSSWLAGKEAHQIATLDPENLSVLAEWKSPDYITWLAMP